MTGNELKRKLITVLEAALPDAEIKAAFTGRAKRKPDKPVICVGVLKEERSGNSYHIVLDIRLYTCRAEKSAVLFEAVCTVIGGLPCAVRSVSREELRYHETLGCLETVCRAELEAAVPLEDAEAMRFGDFVFESLPEALEMKRHGNMQETVMVSGQTQTEYTGGGRREVTGKGVFFGADGTSRYAELEKSFGKINTLFLPGIAPFFAVLRILSVTEPVAAGTVRFEFGFEEVWEREDDPSGRTHLAAAGESLWDYADRAGVSIEDMVKANPHIVCINALQDGEEVHIP